MSKANVEIFGRSTPVCPLCVTAKQYCDTHGVSYVYLDLAKDEWNPAILMDERGISTRTLPILFVNGKFVERGLPGLRDALDAESIGESFKDSL